MGHYKSNLRDIEFNLFEVFGTDQVLGQGPFSELDVDSARDVLKEVERLATEDLAASFTDSDRNPPVFDKDAVRYALFIFSALGLWGAWHYWIAPRTLKDDLARAVAA